LVLNKFRHQTVPGRRVPRTPAPLQERNASMDQLMRQVHESPRFDFEEACKSVAEGTRKVRADVQ
jgi:hypothetical protein